MSAIEQSACQMAEFAERLKNFTKKIAPAECVAADFSWTAYRRRQSADARFLAQSGHPAVARQCPLSGVKRTSRFQSVMSASDPRRTFARQKCISGCPASSAVHFAPINAVIAKTNSSPAWWGSDRYKPEVES